jgi:hypothetical protein
MTPSAGEQFLEDVVKPVVDVSDISKKIRLALHRPVPSASRMTSRSKGE